MSFWDQIGGFGSDILDTAGDLVTNWGDSYENKNLAIQQNIQTAQAKVELAKAAFFREQARRDEMQKTIQAVVYSALFMGGLYLLFTMLKGMKK